MIKVNEYNLMAMLDSLVDHTLNITETQDMILKYYQLKPKYKKELEND